MNSQNKESPFGIINNKANVYLNWAKEKALFKMSSRKTQRSGHVYHGLGCAIPPLFSQNDSAIILSSDACPQDYRIIKIIFVASVLGVPQNTTFL